MRSKQKIKKYVALLMGLTLGLMFSMNAMAASSQEATIAGAAVKAWCSVTYTFGEGGTGSLNYTDSVWATVSGTCTYIDLASGATRNMSNANENVSSAYISFIAPKDCLFFNVKCSHTVSNKGQNWSCTTEANYLNNNQ